MFEPWYLFVSIVMGLIGMWALQFGRRQGSPRHIVIALALMLVPYFLVDAQWLAVGGTALVLLLFFP